MTKSFPFIPKQLTWHVAGVYKTRMILSRKTCSVSIVENTVHFVSPLHFIVNRMNDLFLRFSLITMNSGNNMNIGGHRDYDHGYCREISQHLLHSRDLPTECMKFNDLVAEMKSRETDTTHYSQFLS